MGVAGLVLGILSAIGGWIPGVSFFAWAFGIIGIILSAIGRSSASKAGKPTGIATAGLVLSIIGTIFSFIGLICTVVCLGAAGAASGLFGSF